MKELFARVPWWAWLIAGAIFVGILAALAWWYGRQAESVGVVAVAAAVGSAVLRTSAARAQREREEGEAEATAYRVEAERLRAEAEDVRDGDSHAAADWLRGGP